MGQLCAVDVLKVHLGPFHVDLDELLLDCFLHLSHCFWRFEPIQHLKLIWIRDRFHFFFLKNILDETCLCFLEIRDHIKVLDLVERILHLYLVDNPSSFVLLD